MQQEQPTIQHPVAPVVTENSWNIPGAINFYNSNAPYYEFTNFYQNPVQIDGKKWPTTEHYYQAMKFDAITLPCKSKLEKWVQHEKSLILRRQNKNSVSPRLAESKLTDIHAQSSSSKIMKILH